MGNENIHERIKSARMRKGLTQTEISEQIGITLTAYNRAELGKTKPRTGTLKKIAEVTSTEYTWLLEGNGDIQENEITQLEKGYPAYIIEITDLANEGFSNLNKLKMKGNKIYLPGLKEGDNFGLILNNRNHEPEIREGSTIIFSPIEETAFENNKLYLVIISGTPVVRRIEKVIGGPDTGKLKLSDNNSTQIINSEEIQAWFRITHSFQSH